MKFIITNRTRAKKLSYHYRHYKFGMISITDSASNNNLFCREAIYMRLLRLKFDDVDKEGDTFVLFTKEQAIQILNFVKQIKNKVDFIIVHCEAGISRSAGVVAALEKIYNNDNNYVFKYYCPNSFVYRTILECYYNKEN